MSSLSYRPIRSSAWYPRKGVTNTILLELLKNQKLRGELLSDFNNIIIFVRNNVHIFFIVNLSELFSICKQFRSSWANWQPLDHQKDHQRRSNKDIDDGHGFGVTGKYCRTKNVPIPSKLAKNLSQYLSCFSIIIPLRSLAGRLWSSELVKIKHPLT